MADSSLNDLSEMQKLTSSMVKDYASILDGKKRVNKELKEAVKFQQDIVKSLKSAEEIDEAIEKIEKNQNALLNSNKKLNQGILIALQAQSTAVKEMLSAQKEIFKADEQKRKILQSVNDKMDGITDSMTHQLDNLKEQLHDIPLLGKYFEKLIPFDKIKDGVTKLGNAFKKQFEEGFTKEFAKSGSVLKSVLGGMKSGVAGISAEVAALGPMLAGPQAILIAMAAVIALGVLRMYQIEKASQAFKKSTGLLNNDMKGVQRQISKVSAQYAQIGVHAEDVANYAAQFYNQFNGTQMASDAVVASMGVLEKNFGVAVESQVKLNQLLQSASDLTQTQAQAMIGIVTNMADAANIAPDKVIKDMAENSQAMYQYFHGSAEEMAKGAVYAAKMGTSITQMSSMAESLLNFETSLTDELNAGAILGKNFNLSIARSAAAAGDLPGMYEAVLDAVGQTKDITKMTKFEQDAIVKATGMQIDELANGQKVRAKFANASKEQLAAAMEELKIGKDIKDINEEDLETLVKTQKKRKEAQGQIEALGHMLHGFGQLIMDAFLPIGQAFVQVITPVVAALGSFIKGFVTPIAAVFKRISDKISEMTENLGGAEKVGKVLGKIFEFIGTLVAGPIVWGIEFVVTAMESVIDIVNGIIKLFKGDFAGGIKDIGMGLIGIFQALPLSLYRAFVDIFPAIGDAVARWWDGLVSWLANTAKGILPDWAVKLISGFGGESAKRTEESNTDGISDGGSVNDGVIQNGKIITTNPADTLIAAKNPSDILGKALGMSPLGMLANGIGSMLGGGSGNVDMGPLIAEIQGLRADMAAGKIAVHMDGRKVTSGITKIAGQSAANSYVQR